MKDHTFLSYTAPFFLEREISNRSCR